MRLQLPLSVVILICLTCYLWSVPLALSVSDALDWQYDADLGWWLIAGYTAPVMFLGEPFRGTVSFETMKEAYLAALTVWTAFVSALALFSKVRNGS